MTIDQEGEEMELLPSLDDIHNARNQRKQLAADEEDKLTQQQDDAWGLLRTASSEFIEKARALNLIPDVRIIIYRHKRERTLSRLWTDDKVIYTRGQNMDVWWSTSDLAMDTHGELWFKKVTSRHYDGHDGSNECFSDDTWDWTRHSWNTPVGTPPALLSVVEWYRKVLT